MGPRGLDDLRSILLSERETGRLTAVAPDLFDRGHAELVTLINKVYEFEDPLSEEARSLIEETLAIKETLQELFRFTVAQNSRPDYPACRRKLLRP